ncbi:hypothetical protein L3Q65_24330 [Amycolatopsis sp. FU40]|nr:hypothetical protein [Amycolatopsis sp. FU40]UKD51059.1 hypothetical protein L3Q65_24330 [Amycolatopsis sp. FU40]
MHQPLQPVPGPRPPDHTWIVVIAATVLGTIVTAARISLEHDVIVL